MKRPSLKRRLKKLAASLYRPPVLGAAAILAGAAVAAPHAVRLTRELAREPIYLVEGGEVKISRPNDHVDPAFFREALEASGLGTTLSVADPTLVPRLAATLGESPWVESVDHVSATLREGVRVVLTYRRAAVMVRTASGVFPVDGRGVVLPGRGFDRDAAAELPTMPLFDGRPAAAGQRWRDERVLGAAAVAARLQEGEQSVWRRADLREVRPDDEGGFELWTAAGTRVVWGRAEGDGVVEPTAEQKAGKLAHLLDRRGSLDKPAGPYRIDLRRWDQIVLEPIAAAMR